MVDPNDHSVRPDEQDIQRDQGILHPESHRTILSQIKQHAGVRGERLAVHQPIQDQTTSFRLRHILV